MRPSSDRNRSSGVSDSVAGLVRMNHHQLVSDEGHHLDRFDDHFVHAKSIQRNDDNSAWNAPMSRMDKVKQRIAVRNGIADL